MTAAMTTPRKSPKADGQKSVGIKPTNQEIEERVEYVAGLLVKLKKPHEIRRAIQKRWKVHWLTCNRYVVRANKFLQSRSRMDKEEARCIGVNALLRVIAVGKPNEIVQAEKRWADIWGYNMPTVIRDNLRPQQEITITNSQPEVHLYLPEGRSAMFRPPEPPCSKPEQPQ